MATRSPDHYAPGLSDEKVLRAIGRYFYLTAEQITRLLFSPNSHTYTSEILTRLTRERYLERTVMPRESEFGRGKSVWSLMGKGRSFLEGLGISLLPRVSHTAVRSHSHFRHLLAVNDALIACEVFARDEPGVDLAGFVHERTFHRTPERVELVFSQMLGVAIARYVVEVEPLASLPVDELARRLGPVLQHHLLG